jgi:hypothetical protein
MAAPIGRTLGGIRLAWASAASRDITWRNWPAAMLQEPYMAKARG